MLAEKNLGMLLENSEIVNFLNINESLFNVLCFVIQIYNISDTNTNQCIERILT
jgi:hypothetical protein